MVTYDHTGSSWNCCQLNDVLRPVDSSFSLKMACTATLGIDPILSLGVQSARKHCECLPVRAGHVLSHHALLVHLHLSLQCSTFHSAASRIWLDVIHAPACVQDLMQQAQQAP